MRSGIVVLGLLFLPPGDTSSIRRTDSTIVIFETDLSVGGMDPWRIRPLPTGHILVVDEGGGAVYEVDREGTVVWKGDGLDGPRDAVRPRNGSTLIVECTGRRVTEILRDGTRRIFAGNLGVPYRIEINPYHARGFTP